MRTKRGRHTSLMPFTDLECTVLTVLPAHLRSEGQGCSYGLVYSHQRKAVCFAVIALIRRFLHFQVLMVHYTPREVLFLKGTVQFHRLSRPRSMNVSTLGLKTRHAVLALKQWFSTRGSGPFFIVM